MHTSSRTLLNERYRLDDEIGRGGMGVVFQGWDTLLQRKVAIKILNQEALGGGGTDRLLEEARVIARLDHPNIVTLFDAGEVGSDAFIVMQLVEGKTLSTFESLDLMVIMSIGIQICSALSHAHGNGIVHRDLKPDNIFLAGYPQSGEAIQYLRVKIVDFGLAHSDLANMTIQGEIAGTVSYMAPEQALGQKTSPQTDLYGYGVILYQQATGQLPFTGDNPLNVISQHINSPVNPPSRINPEIPAELEALILQLMNKSPDERPSSAQEVENILQGLLHAKRNFDPEALFSLQGHTPEPNLPEQLTSFVGREQEIAEISDLIRQDSCRLLTLVGLGGIGKTRLAIEAAAQNTEGFKDGIFFISLASISGPDFILSAIAETMGIALQTHGSVDPESQLFDFLAKRNSLLILDNFEHLMDGSDMLVDLLKRSPAIKLMVTSRQRLNIQGEWTFKLEGLKFPRNGHQEKDINRSAVQLFIDRAKLADARFSLADDERKDVIRICQMVAGIPLGIELASAWISMLSPQEIADEIERNLDFLSSSMQDLPEKHHSMRAAFDYSWAMLSREQRDIFRRLCVFRGGFNRQAAAEVADAGLMDISKLVDKSFVRGEKSDRYEIHELLRQYGLEKQREDLAEFGEISALHSQYYFEYLNQRRSKLVGEKQLNARDEIQAEIENIRVAIQWGIAGGNAQGVQSAFQVLSYFYFIQGYYEAVESYKNFAGKIEDQYETEYDHEKPGSLMYFAARAHQVFYLSMLGSIEEADEIAKNILPGLRELDIRPEIVYCLISLGINASFRGEYEDALQDLEEALNIAERNQQSFWIVGSKIWLGWVYYEQGDHAAALQEWQEGEQISVEINNRLLLAFVQSKLALLGEETGDYKNAIKIQLQARENFQQFGDQVGVGYATSRLALSLIGIGEYREAKRFGHEALQSYREMNHSWGIPASLCRIGFAEIELGEYEAAWMHLSEALKLSRQGQIGTLVLYSLIGLAKLMEVEKQTEQGIKVLAFVVTNPNTPSLYREIARQSLEESERELPLDKFKAAKAAGEKAQLEEIVNSIPASLEELKTA